MTLAAELPMMSVTLPHSAAAAAAAVAAAAAAVANSNSNSSQSKSKLGFSIDSIVGNESSKLRDSLNMSPTDLTTKVNHPSRSRSRSPPRSKSTSPATSPPPSSEGSAPLVRPIPTSFPGGISPQTYLDQLAHLKAIYEQHQQQNLNQHSPGSPNSTPTSPPATSTTPSTTSLGGSAGPTTSTASIGPPPPHGLPPGPLPPGFPPGFAFPRPGGLPGAPPGLPPLLFGAGGPGGPQIPPQIPREYPLYPWFISRRFPGGKCCTLTRILLEKDGGRAGMWYVIDGSKTPMLYYYYYDSERSLHVGLSISDAPLGRTMLIRRGQLFREENLKRSGAIFEVILLWWPEPQTLVIIAS